MEPSGDVRDLVLSNNTYAHVLDETKGNIICYVGPNKVQLAGTDKLVCFNSETKTYERALPKEGIKNIYVAPEGWYIILKNPAKDGNQPTPSSNENISLQKLDVGRKIHIPGPCAFALWPGQMGQVVQGHRLRSNQYLIVRVYDADAAKKNWGSSIIQTTSSVVEQDQVKKIPVADPDTPVDKVTEGETPVIKEETSMAGSILDSSIDFTIGKLMIVKGTDVSFFIPPTGIEVVKDESGKYIREAVTLERLIYCILLDENGSKRYIRGPAVVFPRPTEVFQVQNINDKITRRFRAIELNEISGIYVKVIAPYEENGEKFTEGQELFITGKEQSIYYRRDEHQIVRYGDKEIHYATAIPKGEARYVLNRLTGEIDTIYGPFMCLPDPRTKVLVRRNIPLDLIKLMYPGNNEAIEYNQRLKTLAGSVTDFVTDTAYSVSQNETPELTASFRSTAAPSLSHRSMKSMLYSETNNAMGDTGILTKSSTYTKPRTVTLDSKYDGAVRIKVWTGYAVMVVDGVGKRKIVEGPAIYNFAYDEYPEIITLSTGKPKSTDKLLRDIYLRTKNNKVSDIVVVETKDMVEIAIKLSYRLNFIEDSDKWFDVENYVKFLCDHMRSRLKGYAQSCPVSEFYANSVDLIRNVILGEKTEGKKRGYLFEENNMFISDVEILKVSINDAEIENSISQTQQQIVTTTITTARKEELLALQKRAAAVEEEIKQIELETLKKGAVHSKEKHTLYVAELGRKQAINILAITQDTEQNELRSRKEIERKQMVLDAKVEEQKKLDTVAAAELERQKTQDEHDLGYKQKELNMDKDSIVAQSEAIVSQLKAIQPGLIEALSGNSQMINLAKIMPEIVPLSVVEGKSVSATLSNLFQGTAIGKVLDNINARRPSVEQD